MEPVIFLLFSLLSPLISLFLFFVNTGFATSAENMDCSKQYWLHECLLEDPIQESTSFRDCSRLYCLQGESSSFFLSNFSLISSSPFFSLNFLNSNIFQKLFALNLSLNFFSIFLPLPSQVHTIRMFGGCYLYLIVCWK